MSKGTTPIVLIGLSIAMYNYFLDYLLYSRQSSSHREGCVAFIIPRNFYHAVAVVADVICLSNYYVIPYEYLGYIGGLG